MKRHTVSGLGVVLLAMTWNSASAATMFWTSNTTDSIGRADIDGSNVQTIIGASIVEPAGITIDALTGKLYWVEEAQNLSPSRIQRANLDGSAIEQVLANNDLCTCDLSGPLAVDSTDAKVYFRGNRSIRRANIDGTDIEEVITPDNADISGAVGIAVDWISGKLYWADSNVRKVQRSNLDGTDVEELITDFPIYPASLRGITLDLARRHVYMASGTGEQGYILRANLDGSDVETLLTTDTIGTPDDLIVDSLGGKLYWIQAAGNGSPTRIQSANVDGSGIQTVLTFPNTTLRGIALDLSGHAPADIDRDFDVDGDDIDRFHDFPIDLNDDSATDFGDVRQFVRDWVGTELGDVNVDYRVNITDLSLLAVNFGRPNVGWAGGDINGDDVVNIADLSLLALHFGFDAGGSAAATIPEPATMTFGIAAMLAWSSLGRFQLRR